MKLSSSQVQLASKLHRMDVVANTFLLCGMVGILIGITEGGIVYPWSDWKIVLSFTCGIIGLLLFFAIDFIPNRLARNPVLPIRLFANRTSASCYLMTFIQSYYIWFDLHSSRVLSGSQRSDTSQVGH